VAHVSRILKEAGENFDLDNLSAHSMRKTYAYKIYTESGHDIVAVKELLGHSSIEITKRYLGLDKELYSNYSSKLNNLIR
jgi:integrase